MQIRLLLLVLACFAIIQPRLVGADIPNLLPAIPEPKTNPFLATAFEGVRIGDKADLIGAKAQDEIIPAMMAYLHPASPHRGQQPYLDRLCALLDARLSAWTAGQDLSDHMFSFECTYAYLALKTLAPDKIPADKQEAWEAAVARHTHYLIDQNPDIYQKHLVGALIVNMDIFRTMSVWLGGLATGDSTSADLGRAAVEECMTKSVLGDGATHYANYSNETYVYHASIVNGGTWYYLLTGSPAMKAFLEKMVPYYPLTTHPGGFAEYSTAPPWKPFYDSGLPLLPALKMSYLTGDGYNAELGQKAKGDLQACLLYRSGVKANQDLPDNFTLYDRNILGPRARYGAWGEVGTTRDPSTGQPEADEKFTSPTVGLGTFAGAYILRSPAGKLDAAFHGACPEVKVKSGNETDWNRGNCWAFLTGPKCHNGLTRSHSVYGLTACYPIYSHDGKASGWDGTQEWVYTPDRVIGLSALHTSDSREAFGLAERVILFSHRGSSQPGDGQAQELVANGPNAWTYGKLKLKVDATTFAGRAETMYYGLMANYGPYHVPDDQGSVMIHLHDAQSGADQKTDYPPGTERSALLEISPVDKADSTQAEVLKLPEGLRGFEFAEDAGRKIRLVHNVTDHDITYSDSMPASFGQARMLENWDDAALHVLPVANGSITIPPVQIPAWGHILVINSNVPADQEAGHLEYAQVFHN